MNAVQKRETVCISLTNYSKSGRPFHNVLQVEPLDICGRALFLASSSITPLPIGRVPPAGSAGAEQHAKPALTMEGLACVALAGLRKKSPPSFAGLALPSLPATSLKLPVQSVAYTFDSESGAPESSAASQENKDRKVQRNAQRKQWKKYGRKVMKKRKLESGESVRCYYKCNYPGCSAKKQVDKVVANGIVIQAFSQVQGVHNHPFTGPYTCDDYYDARKSNATGGTGTDTSQQPSVLDQGGELGQLGEQREEGPKVEQRPDSGGSRGGSEEDNGDSGGSGGISPQDNGGSGGSGGHGGSGDSVDNEARRSEDSDNADNADNSPGEPHESDAPNNTLLAHSTSGLNVGAALASTQGAGGTKATPTASLSEQRLGELLLEHLSTISQQQQHAGAAAEAQPAAVPVPGPPEQGAGQEQFMAQMASMFNTMKPGMAQLPSLGNGPEQQVLLQSMWIGMQMGTAFANNQSLESRSAMPPASSGAVAYTQNSDDAAEESEENPPAGPAQQS